MRRDAKRMKSKSHILSFLVAMVMLVTLAFPAMAAPAEEERNETITFGELVRLPDDDSISPRIGRPSNTGIDISAYNYNTGDHSEIMVQYRWAGIPAATATIGQNNVDSAEARGYNGWYVKVYFTVQGSPSSYMFSVDDQVLYNGPISAGNYYVDYYTPMFNYNQQYKIVLDGSSGTCWGNIYAT